CQQAHVFFNKTADWRAEFPQQPRNEEKTRRAAHQGKGDEGAKVHLRDAAGDGDELVGNGGKSPGQHDPGAPFFVKPLKTRELLVIAIEFDDPYADRIVEEVADRVGENA